MTRRHRYGVRWMPTWPHVSLGVSAHFDRKFGHLSLHLPIGVVIVGFTGEDLPAVDTDTDATENEIDALHSVVRRLLDGWEYLSAVDEWPDTWSHCDLDKLDDRPLTPAEAAAIRAALDVPAADTDTEDTTDG